MTTIREVACGCLGSNLSKILAYHATKDTSRSVVMTTDREVARGSLR